jgi:NAD(P)-dependent dehydrogenase (short-subunit alcohol dehydrogenase family)
MRAIDPGAIIHIASISALHGNPGRSAYGAFKGGVTAR